MVSEEGAVSGVGRGAGNLFSRFKWKLTSSVPIKVDSISVVDGRYLTTARSNNLRLFSLLRVHLSDSTEESKLDYSAAVRITLQHQRMKGLLDGLHRAKIPFLYTMMVKPSNQDEEEENQVFEFDLVVGTWMDARGKDLQEARTLCEQNAATLAATLSVGLPNSSVRRLTRNELVGFAQALLLPAEPRLRQVADSATLSTLESFEGHGPAVASMSVSPDFYIPNAKESGERGEGIVLGRVKSRSGSSHEFRLQLEDLRRHVTLMGMTGSGKSTTAGVIVRQVAAMGLPVMILDWHNEHADLVKSVGGKVLSPGKDDFAINPMDMGPATEPAEHVEMVTDIFSDTYHFTHPQAYMFRNALQRCLAEAVDREVPDPRLPRRHDRELPAQVGLRQRDQGRAAQEARAPHAGPRWAGLQLALEPHGRRAARQGPVRRAGTHQGDALEERLRRHPLEARLRDEARQEGEDGAPNDDRGGSQHRPGQEGRGPGRAWGRG